jgi:hypothetical protein
MGHNAVSPTWSSSMTPESEYLIDLAKRNLQPYLKLPQLRAAMLTGSAALSLSDRYSDIDMTLYYDSLPTEEELTTARLQNGGSDRLWLIGDRKTGDIAESYYVHGVECQFGHITLAAWERDMATVLEGFDVNTPLQKALSGTLECIPLHGLDLLETWKAKIADYPPGLAQAMVEQHLQFFPLWNLHEPLAARDAVLWRYQIMTEAAYNLLAILAGLNQLYFTTFQFKRLQHFVEQMTLVPPAFAARLDQLFTTPAADAARDLKILVDETLDLVALHMPQVDLATARQHLERRRPEWQLTNTAE